MSTDEDELLEAYRNKFYNLLNENSQRIRDIISEIRQENDRSAKKTSEYLDKIFKINEGYTSKNIKFYNYIDSDGNILEVVVTKNILYSVKRI